MTNENTARIQAAYEALGENLDTDAILEELESVKESATEAHIVGLENQALELKNEKARKRAEAKEAKSEAERCAAKPVPINIGSPPRTLHELIAALTITRKTMAEFITDAMEPLDQPLGVVRGLMESGQGSMIDTKITRAFLDKTWDAAKAGSNGKDVLNAGDVLTTWFVSKANACIESVRSSSYEDFRIVLEFHNKLREAARVKYRVVGHVTDLDGITPEAVDAYNRVVTNSLGLQGHPDRSRVSDTAAVNAAGEEAVRRRNEQRVQQEKQAKQARIDSLCGV